MTSACSALPDTALPAAELRAFDRALGERWSYGSNCVVGWTPRRDSVDIVVVPVLKAFRVPRLHPRIFAAERRLTPEALAEVAREFEVKPESIRLRGCAGAETPESLCRAIEDVVARYAIRKTRQRAAFLIDIANFSLFSPEEQAAQLSVLGYSLNIAEKVARENGLEVNLARSNTGDGFYVWNRRTGLAADIDLYCTLMLVLAHHALQHRRVEDAFLPTIRCCFDVGSHYSYSQCDLGGPIAAEYIVGDLTINLARLIAFAEANQILVADFVHENEDGSQRTDTEGFVFAVRRTLGRLTDVRMQDAEVEHISAYLTGARNADGTYTARRLKVIDKHGFAHTAYNAKVNIFLARGEPIYLGLQDAELGELLRARKNGFVAA